MTDMQTVGDMLLDFHDRCLWDKRRELLEKLRDALCDFERRVWLVVPDD